MKRFASVSSAVALFAFPLISLAQFTQTGDIVDQLAEIVEDGALLLAGVALLVFFWGLVKYIAKADDESAKESGKNIMVGGVIALFVMMSVWGIIAFLAGELQIEVGGDVEPPEISL